MHALNSRFWFSFAFSAGLITSYAQQAQEAKHLPIIDVHVHAMKVNPQFAGDLCPWFLSNMPGADPNGPPPQFFNTDCANSLKAAKSDKEFQDELTKTMKRLNMTIIASGDAEILRAWSKANPAVLFPASVFLMQTRCL